MYRRWRSFWSRLFARPRHGAGKEKVLEYIVHRLDGGSRLREVVADEYVRRRATPREMEQVLADSRVVEATRRRMRRDLTPYVRSTTGRR